MGVEADSEWQRNWNERLWVVCQHVALTLLYESGCYPSQNQSGSAEPSPIHIETTLPTTPTRQRPPKRIKICEPSPIPIHTFRRHPARQAPPKPNPKNPANPHPYTWSKNPYRSSYLGKKKTWQSLLSRLPTLKTTSPSECPCSKNLQAQLMVDASQQNSLKGSVHPNLLHPKDNPYPRGGGTNHHLK